MNKKKICIIYTGGTIGMIPTDHGYAPKSGYFADALSKIDELSAEGMPAWDFIEFDPLLDSSNITVAQWNQIGRAIRDNYDSYDGFVVLHGTDTMSPRLIAECRQPLFCCCICYYYTPSGASFHLRFSAA